MSKNPAMFDKLRDLRPNLRPRQSSMDSDIRKPSPSPMKWKADGEDHINIWENGATDLGKILAHNSKLPFDHCVFGNFGNMEAFWHYIRSEERDDRIRNMSGLPLKNFTRQLTNARVENFRAIIVHSNYQRIMQYKPLVDALRESTLPFDCYFVNPNSGIRIRPSFFKWLIKGFEEIRAALKENREPNFNQFLDHRDSTIYQFVAPSYSEKAVAEKSKPTKSKQTQGALLNAVSAQIAAQQEAELSQNATGENEQLLVEPVADAAEQSSDVEAPLDVEAPVFETIGNEAGLNTAEPVNQEQVAA